MSQYRRIVSPGGTFFFTVVTARRRKIFAVEPARRIFRDCLVSVQAELPFDEVAWVILPDHVHAIWTLPDTDPDFSTRWRRIKGDFTRRYLLLGGAEASKSQSRRAHGDRGVWQRRFWEHLIRDEADLHRHLDYIHYNPVKHAVVKRADDWPSTSFHDHVRDGYYPADWGSKEPESIEDLWLE